MHPLIKPFIVLVCFALFTLPSFATQPSSIAGWQYLVPNSWQAALTLGEEKEFNLSYLLPEPDNIDDLPAVRIRSTFQISEVEGSAVTSLANLIVEAMELEDASIVDIGDRELRKEEEFSYKFVEIEIKGSNGLETHFFAYLDGNDDHAVMVHLRGIKQLAKFNRSTFHRFFHNFTKASWVRSSA